MDFIKLNMSLFESHVNLYRFVYVVIKLSELSFKALAKEELAVANPTGTTHTAYTL